MKKEVTRTASCNVYPCNFFWNCYNLQQEKQSFLYHLFMD